MVNFERGLQTAGLDQSLGLPYWDWTDGPNKEPLQLPLLATQDHWLDGIIKKYNNKTSRYTYCTFLWHFVHTSI